MNIPDLLRASMKEHDLSPYELARKLSISESYAIDILAGRCSISTYVAVRLEQTLGIDAEHLLTLQVRKELAKARIEFGR